MFSGLKYPTFEMEFVKSNSGLEFGPQINYVGEDKNSRDWILGREGEKKRKKTKETEKKEQKQGGTVYIRQVPST